MYIDEPPESIDQSSEINVLNLSGSSDWREDDRIQCLVKNGEVLYESLSEKRKTWQKLTAEEAREIDVGRTQRYFDYWNAKGYFMIHKLKKFLDTLAIKEKWDFKDAITYNQAWKWYLEDMAETCVQGERHMIMKSLAKREYVEYERKAVDRRPD